jgi:hypothetical protein
MGRGECNACLESDYEGRAALGKVSAIFQEITRERGPGSYWTAHEPVNVFFDAYGVVHSPVIYSAFHS